MSTQPLAIFSAFRRLRASFQGPAITYRRTSDSVEDAAEFRGNYVDQQQVVSFAGSSSLAVKTWHDQANSNDLSQTTTSAQPLLVSSGTREILTNRPAISWQGTDDQLFRNDAFGLTGSPALTVCWVFKCASTGSTIMWAFGGTANNSWFGAFPPEPSDSPSGAVVGQGGTAFRAFTGGVAQNTVGYQAAGKASSATPSAFTLEANGSALSQQSVGAGGATALSMVNTVTRIGCHVNGTTNFATFRCNFWGVWNAVLSGDDLALVRAEMSFHAT